MSGGNRLSALTRRAQPLALLPETLALLPRTLAGTAKGLALLPKALAHSAKALALLPKAMARSAKPLALLAKTLAFLSETLARSAKPLALLPKVSARSAKVLALFPRALGLLPEASARRALRETLRAMTEDALETFNHLSGSLAIELTEPAVRVAPHMLNVAAPPTAKIKSVSLELHVYDEDAEDEFRPLTEAEWSLVVLEEPHIRMADVDTPEVVIEHDAPNGKSFTVRDLKAAIEKTERESREKGEWLGGIDVHHVFFEGIELEDGVWLICWGS